MPNEKTLDKTVPHPVPLQTQMTRKQKLYDKAVQTPENLRFKELCSLAKQVGFELRNKRGSHHIFKHPTIRKMINLQPDKRDSSKAKKYQVENLIFYINQYNLIED